MCKKWKSVFAAGSAALLVCLVPARTMMAAEENEEKAQEAGMDLGSSNDTVNDVIIISDKQGGSRVSNADESGKIDSETNAKEDGKTADGTGAAEDGKAADETDADENGKDADETDADENGKGDGGTDADENGKDDGGTDADGDGKVNVEAGADGDGNASDADYEETSANGEEASDVPVINIRWWGDEPACAPGGHIDYKYVNYQGCSIEFSAGQEGQAVSVSWYLDKVADITAEAKKNEEMASLPWINDSMNSVMLLRDGNYVLYVKAETDGHITYARSGGIVVDTKAPEITGIEEGRTYPEGTLFRVKDINLKDVEVNGITAASVDGEYQVSADGTSACVIRAVDKAGNEKVISINVSVKEPEEEDKVISKNGTYSLKAGVPYQLAEGKWNVNGGATVYYGGSTFYVKADSEYRFTKHWDWWEQ